jgi:hypothetical protein
MAITTTATMIVSEAAARAYNLLRILGTTIIWTVSTTKAALIKEKGIDSLDTGSIITH